MQAGKPKSPPNVVAFINRLATCLMYLAIMGAATAAGVIVFAVFGSILIAGSVLIAVVALGLVVEATLAQSAGELDEAVLHVGQQVTLEAPNAGGIWRVRYRGELWNALILHGRDAAKSGGIGVINAKQGSTLLVSIEDHKHTGLRAIPASRGEGPQVEPFPR